jgi:hypothetical protein
VIENCKMKQVSHSEILELLNGYYKQKNSKVYNLFEFEPTEKRKLRFLFANFRTDGIHSRGLRLTGSGVILLKPVLPHWDMKLENFIPMPRDVLFLNVVCTMPWFLSTDMLILFEAQLAMRFKLAGSMHDLRNSFTY